MAVKVDDPSITGCTATLIKLCRNNLARDLLGQVLAALFFDYMQCLRIYSYIGIMAENTGYKLTYALHVCNNWN